MDLNSLRDMAANISLYDIKAGVRKVQNAVMNYTEMEAKVREATNNEPWGASSTLMQEIANGTFNYGTLNEIMPMIYRRFTEKAAEEWRQIYKALQLLEFLIKHGSERVIDDARSHLTLLKMLRQFHFIDQNGKDQGVNVRNRSKELAELLSDVDRIRSERKKARTTRSKYVGVEGGSSLSFGGSGGGGGGPTAGSSRLSGFGSESARGGTSFGGFSTAAVYGDGGGYGGESADWQDSGSVSGVGTGSRSGRFEEYDEFDEDERPGPSSSRSSRRPDKAPTTPATPSSGSASAAAPAKKADPAKAKAPEVDLFSFDDPAPSLSAGSGLPNMMGTQPTDEDDEFDDFQSAAPTMTQLHQRQGQQQQQPPPRSLPPPLVAAAPSTTISLAAPQPVSAPKQMNLSNMVSLSSVSPAASSPSTPAPNYSAFAPAPQLQPAAAPALVSSSSSGPNYYQSVVAAPPQQLPTLGHAASAGSGPSALSTMASIKPAGGSGKTAASSSGAPAFGSGGGGDAFGALWSQASAAIRKTGTPVPGGGTAMGQLAREKSSAGIWGAPPPAPTGGSGSGSGSGRSGPASGDLGDLLG